MVYMARGDVVLASPSYHYLRNKLLLTGQSVRKSPKRTNQITEEPFINTFTASFADFLSLSDETGATIFVTEFIANWATFC